MKQQRAAVVAALLWVAQARAQPAPGALPASPALIEDPTGKALGPFFAGLQKAEAQRADGRVAIVQIGDSHTAADFFTSHLRHRLGERFGDAGRGFLLPGKPLRHYYQRDARYGTEGKWLLDNGLHLQDAEPFGLAGIRVRPEDPQASAWVGTCATCLSGQRVARFEIFYRRWQSGGKLRYQVDEGPWHDLDTRGDPGTAATAYQLIPVMDGEHRLTLRAAGPGLVDLFGVALERDRPGVVVDSLGVVGAQALHLHRWDFGIIGPQLSHRDPRLVILAYGTNEVENHHLDLAVLEAQYVEIIGRVRAAVPGASILVLGPPDINLRERRDCDPQRKKLRSKSKRTRKGGHAPPGPRPRPAGLLAGGGRVVPPGCEWKTPAVLREIIAVERRAARRTGAAFFDQFSAMGGEGKMEELYRREPRFAYPDHTHLTQSGYEWLAEQLLSDLLRRYEAWKKAGGRS